MKPCPNVNLPEWKKLAQEIGHDAAQLAFIRNGHDIPDIAKARELLGKGGAATPVERKLIEGFDLPPLGPVENEHRDPVTAIGAATKAAQAGPKWKAGVEGTLQELKAVARTLWHKYRAEPAFDNYQKAKGRWDAARQIATFKARQQQAGYDKAFSSEAQVAMFNWIEAGGDAATLRWWADGTEDQKLKAGYERALKLTPAELAGAQDTKQYGDEMRQYAVDNGLWINFLSNYATHIQPTSQSSIIRALLGDYLYNKWESVSQRFKYAAGRVFPTAFAAEQEGFPLKTKKLGDVVAIWSEQLNKTLADRAWIKDNLGVKHTDGRPVFAVAQGTGRVLEPQTEWVVGWPGKESKVFYAEAGQTREDAEQYAAQFPGMSVTEQQSKPPVMIKPWAKTAALADYRTVEHPALRKWVYAATTPEGNPVFVETQVLVHPNFVRDVENALQRSKLDEIPLIPALTKLQSEMKQTMLSASGFHPAQISIHSAEHENFKRVPINPDNPAHRGLIEHGLNIGAQSLGIEDFSEGLMGGGSLLTKIPKVGEYIQALNDWTFHDFIPEIKMSMALAALQRNRDRYRDQLTDDQIQALTAKQANAAFGELNYKMLGRNPTLQHFFRLVLLAPDFLEARAKFVGQAAKPFGKEQRWALLRGAIVMALLSYLLTKLMGEDWDWRHPFQIKYKGKLYGLRTVQGDIIHLITSPRNFAFTRLSPLLGKSGLELATGRDSQGNPVATKEFFQNLAKGWIPLSFRKVADQSLLDTFLNNMGVQEVKYRSAALETARELQLAALPRGPLPSVKRDQSLLTSKLVERARAGEDVEADTEKAYKAGQITETEVARILHAPHETELESVVHGLSLPDQKKVLEKATPAERELIQPVILDKTVHQKPPEDIRAIAVRQRVAAEKEDRQWQNMTVAKAIESGISKVAAQAALTRILEKQAPLESLPIEAKILDSKWPDMIKAALLERLARLKRYQQIQNRPTVEDVVSEAQGGR